MCDRSKEQITENWCKRDTTTRKTDCPFDAVALLEADGWTFRLRNGNHNHEATLAGAHPPIEELLEQRTFFKVLQITQKQVLLHN